MIANARCRSRKKEKKEEAGPAQPGVRSSLLQRHTQDAPSQAAQVHAEV